MGAVQYHRQTITQEVINLTFQSKLRSDKRAKFVGYVIVSHLFADLSLEIQKNIPQTCAILFSLFPTSNLTVLPSQ